MACGCSGPGCSCSPQSPASGRIGSAVYSGPVGAVVNGMRLGSPEDMDISSLSKLSVDSRSSSTQLPRATVVARGLSGEFTGVQNSSAPEGHGYSTAVMAALGGARIGETVFDLGGSGGVLFGPVPLPPKSKSPPIGWPEEWKEKQWEEAMEALWSEGNCKLEITINERGYVIGHETTAYYETISDSGWVYDGLGTWGMGGFTRTIKFHFKIERVTIVHLMVELLSHWVSTSVMVKCPPDGFTNVEMGQRRSPPETIAEGDEVFVSEYSPFTTEKPIAEFWLSVANLAAVGGVKKKIQDKADGPIDKWGGAPPPAKRAPPVVVPGRPPLPPPPQPLPPSPPGISPTPPPRLVPTK